MLETKTCFKNLLLNKYCIILEADLIKKKKELSYDDILTSSKYTIRHTITPLIMYIDLLNCM